MVYFDWGFQFDMFKLKEKNLKSMNKNTPLTIYDMQYNGDGWTVWWIARIIARIFFLDRRYM